jgi:integrase
MAKKTQPKMRGQMAPFQPQELELIRFKLYGLQRYRDLALLNVGIDTMLRASDLVRLRVGDVVRHDGTTRETLTTTQKKTGRPVSCVLKPHTREAITEWLCQGQPAADDNFLFTRIREPGGTHISEMTLRTLVKDWAEMAGLDPREYSGHSLRRTKAAFAYAAGVGLEQIRQSLGHTTITHTQKYLGVKEQDAMDAMRKLDI